MKKNVLFVVNPISGDVDKEDLVAITRKFAKALGLTVELYETTGEDDEDHIRDLFQFYKPERVIVAGGDGTVKMVGEALIKEDTIIGLIPSGSANGLSVDLNFPKEMEEILSIAFLNDPIDLDMVCINDHKSLHLSDIGLNAELIKNYENGSIRGKLGYALQSINTLTAPTVTFKAKVEANGKTIEAESRMLVIANSQKYGTGVTINPLGKMDDGKFEIVIIKNLDFIVFSKIVAGNMPLESGDVEIITTDSAVITTDVPVHFQVDGEYLEEVTRLEAKILHHQMKVATPKPQA